MRSEFRTGLLIGLGAALAIGLYCLWLWQAERQIARHTETLFRRVEQKDWSGVADLIAADYRDQWNNDRARVIERLRLILGFSHKTQIDSSDVSCRIDNGVGFWRGRISIHSDAKDLIAMMNERANSVTTPFELQWRHVSGKPWDWKLVRVSNPELEIPAGFE